MKRRISLYFSLIILIFLFSCKSPIENSTVNNNTIIVNPVTFGTNGIVITDVGSKTKDKINAVAIDNNSKIVAVGSVSTGIFSYFLLTRYNSDGTLDTSFGNGGIVVTPVGADDDIGYSLAIDSNGKIVVAGYTHNGTNYDILVV